ncbi:unnamed protein product [Mytilus coruscus]|uniref:DDE Tnp4 domain-containing protein n=1 Tax=Mytilus coruscus TaxID=42192 RepID=A0A6J8E5M0_MYTCO|nr:unnamed protein product [Mytilus coruscus]
MLSRNILFCDDDPEDYPGRDLFGVISERRLQFYDATGETPETFLDLLGKFRLHIRFSRVLRYLRRLIQCNMLLLTLIWLKCYPTYSILSLIFDTHRRQVSRIVTHVWQVLYKILCDNVRWHTRGQWISKRRTWRKLPEAIGCIDAKSHEILMPSLEIQRQYYNGRRHYHCVHTQVVIDNKKKIVHVESGFRGNNIDVNTFNMMTPIGDGRTLDFQRNCILLGDCIYASRHPVVTLFTSAQLLRLPRQERNVPGKLTRI